MYFRIFVDSVDHFINFKGGGIKKLLGSLVFCYPISQPKCSKLRTMARLLLILPGLLFSPSIYLNLLKLPLLSTGRLSLQFWPIYIFKRVESPEQEGPLSHCLHFTEALRTRHSLCSGIRTCELWNRSCQEREEQTQIWESCAITPALANLSYIL